MISKIRHVGIVVDDLKKISKFFIKTFGFKIFKRVQENKYFIKQILNLKKNSNLTTLKLKAPDGNLIELLKFHNFKSKKKWSGKIFSTGLTHIAFSVKNINKTYKILRKNKNVNFFSKPTNSPDGFAKVCFLSGPEGIIIELVEVNK